jgi:hypothetical protein
MSRSARSAFVVGGVLAVAALIVWLVSGDPSGVVVQRNGTIEDENRVAELHKNDLLAIDVAAAEPRVVEATAGDASDEADASAEVRSAVEAQTLLRANVVHAGLPHGVTAIVVLTHDGRSLVDLAAERGHDPLHLFASAFQFAVTVDGPDDAAFEREFDDSLAELRQPEHRRFELTPDVVATIDIRSAASLHVGVSLYGAPIGWNRVSRGSRETVFMLPADALERGLSAVSLRPVVVANGPPARDARVTLRARYSALRRKNQERVTPDQNGLVEFTDVVPGAYELYVETAAAQWNERVVLVAGERRDIGEVVLTARAPIQVRTLAADGTPITAAIEIGPFDPSVECGELFPASLTRNSRDGAYTMLAPSRSVIVRARVDDWTPMFSPTIVLDPRLGLPTTLELCLEAPVSFAVESRNSAVAKVHVRDAAGLLLELRKPSNGPDASPGLPPGTYTAELVDANGAVIAQQAFTLAAGESNRTIAF